MADEAGSVAREDVVKVSRSVSVCSELPGSDEHEVDGHYPPVLVMFHPTMRTMATRLVRETTNRIMKLKLQSKVATILCILNLPHPQPPSSRPARVA